MKKRHFELIVLLLFMAGGIVLLRDALPKNVLNAAFTGEVIRPYDVPIAVIAIIMLLCFVLLVGNIISAIRERKAKTADTAVDTPAREADGEAAQAKAQEKVNKRKEYLTLALIIGFVIAWKYLGFYIATPIFVFLDTLILPEKRSVKFALLSAVATTVVCYVVFTLLFQIRFPFPLFK